MKPALTLLLLVAAPGVAGCAMLGGGSEPAPAVVPAAQVEGVALSALPDSALPKGACGMVLWTLDEERPAAVFRYIAGGAGEIVVGGRTVSLQRVEATGRSAYGVYEQQSFAAADGMRLDVAVHLTLGFDGGSYLERGLIKIETASGWRTVAPSAGLAGCRSK